MALFIALGGSAYAVKRIGSPQIANNSVRSADLRDRGIAAKDIGTNAITGEQINEAELGFKTAWVTLDEDRNVIDFYNPAGGTPTVVRQNPLRVTDVSISFPGLTLRPDATVNATIGDLNGSFFSGFTVLATVTSESPPRVRLITYKPGGMPFNDGEQGPEVSILVLSR